MTLDVLSILPPDPLGPGWRPKTGHRALPSLGAGALVTPRRLTDVDLRPFLELHTTRPSPLPPFLRSQRALMRPQARRRCGMCLQIPASIFDRGTHCPTCLCHASAPCRLEPCDAGSASKRMWRPHRRPFS